jgi:hypothetical protein
MRLAIRLIEHKSGQTNFDSESLKYSKSVKIWKKCQLLKVFQVSFSTAMNFPGIFLNSLPIVLSYFRPGVNFNSEIADMRDPPVSRRFPRQACSSVRHLRVAATHRARARARPRYKGADRQHRCLNATATAHCLARHPDSTGLKPTASPLLSKPRSLVPGSKPPLIPGLKPRATAAIPAGKHRPHATSARLSQCQLAVASSFLSCCRHSPCRSRAPPSLPRRSLEFGLPE